MLFRYRAALALTLACLLASALLAAKPRRRRIHALPSPLPAADRIYSRRALRRAKIILQLKLMELRAEHLERVRRAIEKNVPIDQLLKT